MEIAAESTQGEGSAGGWRGVVRDVPLTEARNPRAQAMRAKDGKNIVGSVTALKAVRRCSGERGTRRRKKGR